MCERYLLLKEARPHVGTFSETFQQILTLRRENRWASVRNFQGLSVEPEGWREPADSGVKTSCCFHNADWPGVLCPHFCRVSSSDKRIKGQQKCLAQNQEDDSREICIKLGRLLLVWSELDP